MSDKVKPSDIAVDSSPEVLRTFIMERVMNPSVSETLDRHRVDQAGYALALLKKQYPKAGAAVENEIRSHLQRLADRIPTTYRGCVFPMPLSQRRSNLVVGIWNDLAGSYNEEGIARWFQRPRTALDGLTPAEVLDRFDPDSDEVQAVVRLAKELVG